jgi:CheY-like chemotaxis protein
VTVCVVAGPTASPSNGCLSASKLPIPEAFGRVGHLNGRGRRQTVCSTRPAICGKDSSYPSNLSLRGRNFYDAEYMALKSLVVCADEATTQVLRRILETLGLKVDHCSTATKSHPKLSDTHYDSVIIDCENESAAIEILRQMRSSSRSSTGLAIAIAGNQNNVRQMFALGINFVLYKPISVDRAWSSLRAARSLMQREKRRSGRVTVHAKVALDYANMENVPATLIDLSEEGSAVQSEKKLPPDCRVYFQFALPGHASLVQLSGEVVWQDSTGRVGMRFVNVPTSSRRVLHNWLATNAPATVSAAPKVPRPEEKIIKTAPAMPAIPATASQPDSGLARLRSSPGNRRSQSRHACRLSADVYRTGVAVPHRCSLTDISSGGCYVEMPTPFPAGTHVEIVVRAQDMKLWVQGVVQSVHPGFGMGVQLVLKTAENHDHLQSLIRLLNQSDQAEVGPFSDPWTR